MNKHFPAFLAALLMIAPTTAFATGDSGGGDGGGDDGGGESVTENGNPAFLSMPWGLLAGETPIINPGATITDVRGYSMTCPAWFFYGCYDISKTDYYHNLMVTVAGDEIAAFGGDAQAAAKGNPELAGWIEFVAASK